MKIAGAWVGLGLGDSSEEVRRLKAHMRKKFSYCARLADTTLFDPAGWLANAFEPGVAVKKIDKPAFNEYPRWSNNSQSRNGIKVDLFLLHTQEGGTPNADALARWLQGDVSASYHYVVSQAPDGGVTVVDVVDTDRASWSVLSANNRSINLCFAGSSVNWSRQQWLTQAKAIDVAAYLAVQDCKKYGIPLTVIAPPYTAGRAGISDHAYVTRVLKDGTHSDCGPAFPWDVFTAAVNKYAGILPAPAPAPVTVLSKGMSGPQITALQVRLQRNYSKLTATGIFDQRTEDCVKDFQKLRGLTVDGIVGPQTAAALGIKVN